jgi:uncharacterized membrane protein YsdA (DUF1294 family)
MFVSEHAKLLSVRVVRFFLSMLDGVGIEQSRLDMVGFRLLSPLVLACSLAHTHNGETNLLLSKRDMSAGDRQGSSCFSSSRCPTITLSFIYSHEKKRGTHGLDKMPPNRPRPRHRPITPATIAGVFSLVLPTCTLIRLYAATHSVIPIAWTCIASGITFVYYGYDKMQARNLEWRVKEVTLHMLALAGGWPGALLGMHYFQHKTRKTRFQIVFWTTVLAWEGVWWSVWTGKV